MSQSLADQRSASVRVIGVALTLLATWVALAPVQHTLSHDARADGPEQGDPEADCSTCLVLVSNPFAELDPAPNRAPLDPPTASRSAPDVPPRMAAVLPAASDRARAPPLVGPFKVHLPASVRS